MSNAIYTFLASKGFDQARLQGMTCDVPALAKALGYESPDVACAVVAHTRKDGKEFCYLSVSVKGSRNGVFAQLNPGTTLSPEGKAKARAALAALVEAAQAALASLA